MSVFLLLAGSDAHATDQGITGKKLQLKDPSKVKVLSKDSTISIMGSDPIGGADSSIRFDDGTNSVTLALPAAGWSANGAGTLFKYKNDAAPGGPSSIKGVKIGAGKLKVSGKAVPFSVPNGAATVDVVLSLDGGTNTYCMTFTGTGDGDKFLVKDAAAGSCAVCGNNVQEGTEACDGTADTACPGDCLPDCSCAPPCPGSDGEDTVCVAASTAGACQTCCTADPSCSSNCTAAFNAPNFCYILAPNNACTAAANAAGCAAECCP